MNAALNQLGNQLFGSLGQLSIELAALAIFVLLATRVLPIKSPALRHLLWLALLLKPIAALAISSPWTLFTPLISSLQPDSFGFNFSPALLNPGALSASAAASRTIEASTALLTPGGWVAALWVLGAALLLTRISIGYALIGRLQHQTKVHRAGPLFEALQRARLALDCYPDVAVGTSCSIRSPIVLGIWKPLIVVPADFMARLRGDDLEMVLMTRTGARAPLRQSHFADTEIGHRCPVLPSRPMAVRAYVAAGGRTGVR